MAVLSVYGVLLWIFPFLWMFVVPASLPLLDFSPVTGWLFLNEFDLIILLTFLVFLLRKTKTKNALPFPKGAKFCIVLLSCSYIVSTIKGIFPLESIDMNSFSNYYSGYISLRIVKGYVEALMILPMIRLDIGNFANIKKYLIPGFLTGFAGVVFFALWERQLFPGLFNFSNDYRITSTFFEMNTGGAFIDGYLSMLLPLVFSCFLFRRTLISKLIGLGLFGTGLYALLMTFSRICYASFLISMMPLIAGIAVISQKKLKAVVFGGIIVLTAVILTIPVLKGGFIKYRFGRLSQGIDTRTRHWEDAIEKMDATAGTVFFGMGPGTYPKTYFKKTDSIKPGFYQFETQGNNPFLRLFPGDSLYFGQRISLKPDKKYKLTFKARSSKNKGRLTFPICEKSVLHSFSCNWKTIDIVNKKNIWGDYRIIYPGFKIGQGRIYQKRPVEFALYNGNRDIVIDIDNISLTDNAGKNILKNGDFSHGSDFWFFTTDNPLPWHIDNLWISQFFEQGITGLVVFCIFVLFTLIHLILDILKKDMFSLILFCSFCGFFIVGLVNSLFDSPRILFLFYFVSFISIFYSNDVKQ
ncbi:MAG: hypothetical protein GXP56_04200 [Deltaproteobacteria bacterium]|nr:hypothetical protein [Deltaproteobacteria bacterium]